MIILFPVMLGVAAAVLIAMGWPLIFVQTRAGLGGAEIRLLKFRSMTDARDAQGQLLSDELRTPRVGHWIRRFRVDELPAMANMIAGDISLVGPRPLFTTSPANLAKGGARLSVRPGFTGLAQVSGNTLLREGEKLAIDLYYIANQSLLFDVTIVLRTVRTVFLGERRDEAMIARALSLVPEGLSL